MEIRENINPAAASVEGEMNLEKVTRLKELFSSVVSNSVDNEQHYAAGGVMRKVEPQEIAMVEESLLQAGCSQGDLRRLYPLEIQLLGNQTHKIRNILPANHVVRRIMCEHELFLCFMADLEDANARIRLMENRDDTTAAFRKLEHTAWHLSGISSHHVLEDDVIMPELRARGYGFLAETMKLDHLFLDATVAKLAELVKNGHKMQFEFFKRELNLTVSSFVSAGREHVFREDNIMMPTALKVISDLKVWDRINDYCDEVSYCCMHGDI